MGWFLVGRRAAVCPSIAAAGHTRSRRQRPSDLAPRARTCPRTLARLEGCGRPAAAEAGGVWTDTSAL